MSRPSLVMSARNITYGGIPAPSTTASHRDVTATTRRARARLRGRCTAQSRGAYAGVTLDGAYVAVRHDVNEKFYGRKVTARELLYGAVKAPKAAEPLYAKLYEVRSRDGAAHKNRPPLDNWKETSRAGSLRSARDIERG